MEFRHRAFSAYGILSVGILAYGILSIVLLAYSILAMHLVWHIQIIITAWTFNCVNSCYFTYKVHESKFMPQFNAKCINYFLAITAKILKRYKQAQKPSAWSSSYLIDYSKFPLNRCQGRQIEDRIQTRFGYHHRGYGS